MKSFLFTFFIFLSSTTWASSSNSELLSKICLHTLGCEKFQTKSEKPIEMLSEYALFVEEAVVDQERLKISDDLKELPSVGQRNWGLMSKQKAMDFIKSHSFMNWTEGLKKEDLLKIENFLKEGRDLVFGYSPSTGGSLCGAEFPGLIVIDAGEKILYDLSLFGWPSC